MNHSAAHHGDHPLPDEQLAHNVRVGAERSDMIAAAVRSRLDDPSTLTVLDYGCGPGHVGLRLAGAFARVVLADVDAQALDLARAAATGDPSVEVRELDLTRGVPEGLRADVVVSSMSWHHIRDLDAVADALVRVAPGGRLFVADLDADGGAYHRDVDGFDGHDGFDRPALAARLARRGYSDVVVEDLWCGARYTRSGLAPLSVFLLTARIPEV
ncbi:class I SAM-dependent methyltransferase [Xylanimonas allomyrinae]|uniref:Class I SAM-dependent methyltransferase n=1 Tax=Xylanimonas allomyrinae TaxID=2509459 RepID=A0A4P6ENT0_9MICO|nr:class I SAM-dependent methyltransferase [Xylanimonas allomyrinae]QAY61977.1 class I SAM-dependent methyltransferase [Xylanimonas allomyrinae]